MPRFPSPPRRIFVPSSVRGSPPTPSLLPSPADMGTYPAETAPSKAYLLGYTAAAAKRHLTHLEEEHDALAAPVPLTAPPKLDYTPYLPKFSLSDSPNQPRLKIKGPLPEPNYSTSSVTPVAVPPHAPGRKSAPSVLNAAGGTASSMMSGWRSTNIRRMRKKELIHQYWMETMNVDKPTSGMMMGTAPPPGATLERTALVIPKAVNSMTRIPTMEDYKTAVAPVAKTKKKRNRSESVTDSSDDNVMLSTLVDNITLKKPPETNATSLAALPEIKLGANTREQVSEEPSDFHTLKKRLIDTPSYDKSRRVNLKYRESVMADFLKKERTAKSENRNKEKHKKADKRQVIYCASSPGLMVKEVRASALPEPLIYAPDYDPTARDPLAIDPPACSIFTYMTSV